MLIACKPACASIERLAPQLKSLAMTGSIPSGNLSPTARPLKWKKPPAPWGRQPLSIFRLFPYARLMVPTINNRFQIQENRAQFP
jgi:hypothetical protein